jgi:hypothetical protein
MEQKSCSFCRETKLLSDYRQRSKNKDGRANKCKGCVNKDDAIYRKKNAARVLIRSTAFRQAHRAELKERANQRNRSNKEQFNATRRAYYAKNSKRICLKNDESRARHPLTAKNSTLRRKYKLLLDDYLRLSEKYNACCWICKRHQTQVPCQHICVDHDHKTGHVRGLLCRNCNTALGRFNDSISSLSSAIQYLTRSHLSIVFPDLEQPKYSHGTQEYNRNYNLKKNFGITIQQYNWLAETQGYLCPICTTDIKALNGKKHMPVDHCHKNHHIRGILCDKCNVGLGLFQDDPSILRVAIEYLQSPPPLLAKVHCD